VTVVILLRFVRRDCHSAIFGHVSKIVTFVTFVGSNLSNNSALLT
jgi:hypothetical protein